MKKVKKTTLEKEKNTLLKKGLNKNQIKAIMTINGPVMIIAGAGTGKTKVLVERYAYLVLNKNISTENILMLAYNERAAREMEERLDELLPYGYTDRWVHTFHAFCTRLLRAHTAKVQLTSDFTILDSVGQWLKLREIVRPMSSRGELPLCAPATHPTKYLSDIHLHIVHLQEMGISPEEYHEWLYDQTKFGQDPLFFDSEITKTKSTQKSIDLYREISKIYTAYISFLRAEGATDFPGLLTLTYSLLQNSPDVRMWARSQFLYAMVDEYQDTNALQANILKQLFEPGSCANIAIVGDDDQSIYRFRGAHIKNILSFTEEYPNAKTIVLTENYRSRQEILNTSAQLIKSDATERLAGKKIGSIGHIKKHLTQSKRNWILPKVRQPVLAAWFMHHEQEAMWIGESILQLKKKNKKMKWSDCAILTRTNEMSKSLAKICESYGVPFHWMASAGLYNTPTVMDAIAGLRVMAHPHDSLSLWRVLQWPIPNWTITIDHLARAMILRERKPHISLWDALLHPEVCTSSKMKTKVMRVLDCISSAIRTAAHQQALSSLINLFHSSGYTSWILSLSDEKEKQERLRHLELFSIRLHRHATENYNSTVSTFLDDFEGELEADFDGDLPFDPNDGPDAVSIMTLHASKGLEWPVVFIPGCAERKFPSDRRGETFPVPSTLCRTLQIDDEKEQHIREERRLAYVGMTRSKERLYLSGAANYGGSRQYTPSRFIAEARISIFSPSVSPLPSLSHSAIQKNIQHARIPSRSKNKKWSWTQLETYMTCPLQYQFAHIYRIPKKGTHHLSFGNSLHRALQRMHDTLSYQTHEKVFTPQELFLLVDDAWSNDWYPSLEVERAWKQKAYDMIMRYYEWYKAKNDVTIAMEKDFILRLQNGTSRFIVKGKIDRLAHKDNKVVIYDFKTGSPQSLKKLKDSGRIGQLLLYRLAAEKALHLDVDHVSFLYLASSSDSNEIVEVAITPSSQDLLDFEQKILDSMKRAESGDFTPLPEKEKCSLCPYRSICPSRKE
jgi:DNA helicase-2/ATP-dependent DNA helicase PcrA